MSKKIWNSTSIRELARQKLRESENRTISPFQARIKSESEMTASNNDLIDVKTGHEFSWGNYQKSVGDRVLIVVPMSEQGDEGQEISQLSNTLGFHCVDVHVLKKIHKINPASYFGSGFLEQMKAKMLSLGATALVVDAPLSPAQLRNMESIIEAPVVDREGLILSIFEKHAKTSLAKMQVELAQLKYLQPRLAGQWMGLSRQKGGGGGGFKGRGQGETRLELDRRVVKDRISLLTKKLKTAERTLSTQSSRRSSFPRVALVGYTNAGKSTLMNRLTRAGRLESQQLFSTLDTTVRTLVPPTKPKILVSDTVGFVRDLPPDLVASFKSTLREAVESQLILHVLDVSDKHWFEHFETTEAVLEELGVQGQNRVLVLNKTDRLGEFGRLRIGETLREYRRNESYIGHCLLSSLTGEGVPELRKLLIEKLNAQVLEWSAV